jgi:ankyrin repeat protein
MGSTIAEIFWYEHLTKPYPDLLSAVPELLDARDGLELSAVTKLVLNGSTESLSQDLKLDPRAILLRDSYGMLPLHWAARCNNVEAIQMLLEAGADIEAVCKRDMTALTHAASAGSIAGCKKLLQAGADTNATDYAGKTALFKLSGRDGVLEMVTVLLSAGANVNICSHASVSPLIRAALYETSDVCERLLVSGADPDICTRIGQSAVFGAVRVNNHAALRALVKHKASLNLIDYSGNSLLHHAAWFADIKTMQILQKAHIRDLPKDFEAVTGYWRCFCYRNETMHERPESDEDETKAFLALLCSVIPPYLTPLLGDLQLWMPGSFPGDLDQDFTSL